MTVGRDVQVGGDSTTQGNATVKKNLRVEGWLDAPNLTGACKGLFASADELASSYPRPLPGWFAFVGDEFPADIYRSQGGVWVATGAQGTPTYSLTEAIDETRLWEILATEGSEQINASRIPSITGLEEKIAEVTSLKAEQEKLINEAKSLLAGVQSLVESSKRTLEDLIAKAKEEIEEKIAELDSLKELVNSVSGTAYLSVDSNGDVYLRDGRGFYSESFISVKGADANS